MDRREALKAGVAAGLSLFLPSLPVLERTYSQEEFELFKGIITEGLKSIASGYQQMAAVGNGAEYIKMMQQSAMQDPRWKPLIEVGLKRIDPSLPEVIAENDWEQAIRKQGKLDETKRSPKQEHAHISDIVQRDCYDVMHQPFSLYDSSLSN